MNKDYCPVCEIEIESEGAKPLQSHARTNKEHFKKLILLRLKNPDMAKKDFKKKYRVSSRKIEEIDSIIKNISYCEHCNEPIIPDPKSKRGMRSDKKFCSTSCRVMASRKKKKEATEETPPKRDLPSKEDQKAFWVDLNQAWSDTHDDWWDDEDSQKPRPEPETVKVDVDFFQLKILFEMQGETVLALRGQKKDAESEIRRLAENNRQFQFEVEDQVAKADAKCSICESGYEKQLANKDDRIKNIAKKFNEAQKKIKILEEKIKAYAEEKAWPSVDDPNPHRDLMNQKIEEERQQKA